MEEADDHRPHSSAGRPFLSGLCAAALRRKPLGAHTSTAASGEGLVRQLGVLELVLLGIGASIGAGIFVVTGTVARDAGPGQHNSPLAPVAICLLEFGVEGTNNLLVQACSRICNDMENLVESLVRLVNRSRIAWLFGSVKCLN